ncbi:T9SS type A sorting domain-containing protein [Lewinella sp. W8]|uniref:T9SS type A sorting domain-containing protein n=1 Tax=Lewinella sp. W8 TaxID=2528208 RepID=UPI00106861A6|nr:T9SS type A sorting domain-containing protein [Lewinella sp. W8]MTB50645.1 T9SS type A sorting domain-containing protein [Lewinella sp. W8]
MLTRLFKILYSTLLLGCLTIPAKGQIAYAPTALEGANWVQINTRASGSENYGFVQRLEGDTVVGNYTYKKLYRYRMYHDWWNIFDTDSPAPPYYVAQERKLVALLWDDVAGKRVLGRYWTLADTFSSDTLLHDYSLVEGDIMQGAFFKPEASPIEIYSITEEERWGQIRRVIEGDREYIEGVGSLNYGPQSGGLRYRTQDGVTLVLDYCVGELSDCNINVVIPEATPYQPLAVENANWVVWDNQPEGLLTGHRIMSIRGDTMVEGNMYKKLFRRQYLPVNPDYPYPNDVPPYSTSGPTKLWALLRDDTLRQRVYARLIDPDFATAYPGEILLYDFTLAAGDSLPFDSRCNTGGIDLVRWVEYGGALRKYQVINRDVMVSGIGRLRGRFAGVVNLDADCESPIIRAYVANYCVGDDADCGITRPNAVSAIFPNHEISLFPNPVRDQLLIRATPAFLHPVTLTLHNGRGQVLRKDLLTGHQSFDLSTYPAGLYYVALTDQHRTVTHKVVKQ